MADRPERTITMMYNEFMEIAGYEVSYDTYKNIIEPMYTALPGSITKQEFVKMLDKRAFALPTKKQMERELKKQAQFLYENCGRRSWNDEKAAIDRLAKEYAKRFYGIDWTNDSNSFVYFLNGYEYPTVQRGCTYPKTLVIGRNYTEYERLELVKE